MRRSHSAPVLALNLARCRPPGGRVRRRARHESDETIPAHCLIATLAREPLPSSVLWRMLLAAMAASAGAAVHVQHGYLVALTARGQAFATPSVIPTRAG